jgi:hypothetical protein
VNTLDWWNLDVDFSAVTRRQSVSRFIWLRRLEMVDDGHNVQYSGSIYEYRASATARSSTI